MPNIHEAPVGSCSTIQTNYPIYISFLHIPNQGKLAFYVSQHFNLEQVNSLNKINNLMIQVTKNLNEQSIPFAWETMVEKIDSPSLYEFTHILDFEHAVKEQAQSNILNTITPLKESYSIQL